MNRVAPGLLRSAAVAAISAGLGAVLPATSAHADCQPDPASSGQTVICQGNDPNGFAAGAGVDALTVRVRPNATVHDNGTAAISVNDDNVVRNRGTIDAHVGTIGILAGDNNLIINTNEIKTGAIGTGIFVGDNNVVRNRGDITVGVGGIAILGDTANTITNSSTGTINLGAGGIGIEALGSGGDFVVNNGTITGAASTTGIASFGVGSLVINNGTITLGKANPSPSIGVLINSFTTFINNNTIVVGNGGEGVQASGVINFITNNGSITAGKNGVGILAGVVGGDNVIVNNVGASITASGPLGDAVVMQGGGFLFNAGTIANTTPGNVAIDFCSCSSGYALQIAPTSVITGLVTATGNDTFQLGGTGNGTFALNSIGPTKQYEGFGVFEVVSGFWTVDKVFGQNDAWNVFNGTLSGTGTLHDLNVFGGTLQPGTTPGTALKVNGNLAFQTAALYIVTLDGTGSTLAKVTGTASLAGMVGAILLPGVTNQTYTILHSGGLGGTTFDGFSAPGFAGKLTYTPTDVLLNLTANLGGGGTGGNLNINQQNVANALNNVFNNGGTLPGAFLPVFGLTGANLQNALSQLDGEVAVDSKSTAFQSMTEFLTLMLDPFVDGRNGVGSGGALGFAPEREAYFPSDIALAYDAILKKAPPKPSFDQRWTVWGAAYGGSNKTDGDPVIGSNSFTANTFGFAAGMDYHPAPGTILGFALAGGGTNWNLAQALGNGRSDAFQAGVYSTKYFGAAYVSGALAVANHWMTTDRTAMGDQLTARFNGQSVGGRVEAGYRYAVLPTVGVSPYGAAQAQSFHTPNYSETDLTGGGFGLTYAASTATDTRSELGARFDALMAMNDLPMILRGRLAWAHDWVSNPALTAVFQALPGGSFVVNGAAVPANSALASIGAELKLNAKWSLIGKFDGEFSGRSQTYAGSETVRYVW